MDPTRLPLGKARTAVEEARAAFFLEKKLLAFNLRVDRRLQCDQDRVASREQGRSALDDVFVDRCKNCAIDQLAVVGTYTVDSRRIKP